MTYNHNFILDNSGDVNDIHVIIITLNITVNQKLGGRVSFIFQITYQYFQQE